MDKDQLFRKKKPLASDFDFGKQTAVVFDDMLHRSVPFYAEIQRMMGEIAAEFAVEGTNLYDLGCSTANTLLALDPVVPSRVRFVGVDSSQEMLNRAREKLTQQGCQRPYELVCADLNQGVLVTKASVVIMSLTLQFVRPLVRHRLMSSIVQGMQTQGCLILIEKVLPKDSMLNRLFIKYYYGFKERQGYTKTEIAQKREALENVLVPYRLEENMELLLSSGFTQADVFFKWYNFCGLIALK
ncbi:MAG: carboxy-S-adenosyl-L-methionine synthase CmoA [Candidatus Omnitrophica bacterium]|nr:carboxy-S-adenosyl-L-methionine synthase CmoA [Candidatus Omnitrophota bacterium]